MQYAFIQDVPAAEVASLLGEQGLFVWYRRLNDSVVHGSERQDHYANVTLDRESLIRSLGSSSDSMAAMLAQICQSNRATNLAKLRHLHKK